MVKFLKSMPSKEIPNVKLKQIKTVLFNENKNIIDYKSKHPYPKFRCVPRELRCFLPYDFVVSLILLYTKATLKCLNPNHLSF